MASLHTITTEIRTGGKWIGIIVTLFIIFLFVWRLGGVVKEIISPTPPLPPTVAFGKLSVPEFPASLDGSNNSYTLNTVSGSLPTLSDRAKVYKITHEDPSILAPTRAREQVTKVGFYGSGYADSPTVYEWNDLVPPFRKIVLDVLNYNFDITSSYMLIDDIKKGISLPSEPDATILAQSFLSNLSALPIDLDSNKTRTALLSLNGSELSPATSFSNAQVIRVDFYQNDIDNMKIFYPNPPHSSMNFLIAGGKTDGQVVEAHFFHNKIASDSATYPIITANEAWEKLKKGDAIIVSHNSDNKDITVRNVELGYYSANTKQDFLVPIFVFEGSDDFFAYMPAIKKEWFLQD